MNAREKLYLYNTYQENYSVLVEMFSYRVNLLNFFVDKKTSQEDLNYFCHRSSIELRSRTLARDRIRRK